MANCIVWKLTVRGDGRRVIKDIFDSAAVPYPWGCVWDFPGSDIVTCDAELGDGITVIEDAIVIQGQSDWNPPLRLVTMLSGLHPRLTFEIDGTDLINGTFQGWRFMDGRGKLINCVEGCCPEDDSSDAEEIVYMADGAQFLTLPTWVAVENRSMEATEELTNPIEENIEAEVFEDEEEVIVDEEEVMAVLRSLVP